MLRPLSLPLLSTPIFSLSLPLTFRAGPFSLHLVFGQEIRGREVYFFLPPPPLTGLFDLHLGMATPPPFPPSPEKALFSKGAAAPPLVEKKRSRHFLMNLIRETSLPPLFSSNWKEVEPPSPSKVTEEFCPLPGGGGHRRAPSARRGPPSPPKSGFLFPFATVPSLFPLSPFHSRALGRKATMVHFSPPFSYDRRPGIFFFFPSPFQDRWTTPFRSFLPPIPLGLPL